MRVKSRKPLAEYLITSPSVTCFEVVGGADDIVGDQMRQVRGDGQHQVVMRGVHHIDLAPSRCQKCFSRSHRRRVGARRRRQDAQRPSNRLGEAGVGAGILGAGDGWAGNEMHALRARCGAHRATTAPLTEPTSVRMAPGFRCGRDRLGDLA